jgi:hypothetical protein
MAAQKSRDSFNNSEEPWRGIVLCDHGESDCRFRNTVKVFRIADALEKYLQELGVNFERHNTPI